MFAPPAPGCDNVPMGRNEPWKYAHRSAVSTTQPYP